MYAKQRNTVKCISSKILSDIFCFGLRPEDTVVMDLHEVEEVAIENFKVQFGIHYLTFRQKKSPPRLRLEKRLPKPLPMESASFLGMCITEGWVLML